MPDQLYNTVVKNASYNLYGLLGPFYWRLKRAKSNSNNLSTDEDHLTPSKL